MTCHKQLRLSKVFSRGLCLLGIYGLSFDGVSQVRGQLVKRTRDGVILGIDAIGVLCVGALGRVPYADEQFGPAFSTLHRDYWEILDAEPCPDLLRAFHARGHVPRTVEEWIEDANDYGCMNFPWILRALRNCEEKQNG